MEPKRRAGFALAAALAVAGISACANSETPATTAVVDEEAAAADACTGYVLGLLDSMYRNVGNDPESGTRELNDLTNEYGTNSREYEAFLYGTSGGPGGQAHYVRTTEGMQAFLDYLEPDVDQICREGVPG